MRVAVVLFGQPRDYEAGHAALAAFCAKQGAEFDFFYHCWTIHKEEQFSCSPWREIRDRSYDPSTPERLREMYRPLACEYENQSEARLSEAYRGTLAFANTSGACVGNAGNILGQLYSRNKARNLLNAHVERTGAQYDCVLTTRFDLRRMPEVNLRDLDASKTHIFSAHNSVCADVPRRLFSDVCIVCPTAVFLKWFTFYDDLVEVANNEGLAQQMAGIGEALVFNAEQMITAKYFMDNEDLSDVRYFKGALL